MNNKSVPTEMEKHLLEELLAARPRDINPPTATHYDPDVALRGARVQLLYYSGPKILVGVTEEMIYAAVGVVKFPVSFKVEKFPISFKVELCHPESFERFWDYVREVVTTWESVPDKELFNL
jgi:hypothetical protein